MYSWSFYFRENQQKESTTLYTRCRKSNF